MTGPHLPCSPVDDRGNVHAVLAVLLLLVVVAGLVVFFLVREPAEVSDRARTADVEADIGLVPNCRQYPLGTTVKPPHVRDNDLYIRIEIHELDSDIEMLLEIYRYVHFHNLVHKGFHPGFGQSIMDLAFIHPKIGTAKIMARCEPAVPFDPTVG